MKSLPPTLVLAISLVTVLAVVTRAPTEAEGRTQGVARETAEFITVTAVRQSRTMTSHGPRGRLGDVTEQAWSMRTRHGNAIGNFYLYCHWITNRVRLCTAEARFSYGSIVGMGTVDTPLSGSFAVTGGTGRFRHADGEATFNATSVNRMIVKIALE